MAILGLGMNPYGGGGDRELQGIMSGTSTGSRTLDNRLTPQRAANSTTGSTSTSTPQYSASGAGSTASSTQNIDLVNRLFDAQISGFNSQLGTLNAQQDATEARVGNQYTTKSNDLRENLAFGQRNLGDSRNQVNESRARSLQDVRDRLQTQQLGYANQLGAMGAGDSSATGQINMALSGMASKNRAGVQENASGQLTAIDKQQETLEREFERNKRDLDDWKQTTLSDLATEILQTKQKIKQSIAQADVQRAQQLAEYDASYTQQAIDALGKLEALYANQSDQLISRFKNVLAPQTIKIDPALQKYAVQKISAGELRDIGMPEYVNPEAESIAVMKKREEDAQNSILDPIAV